MPHCTTTGVDIYYEVAGEGPPMVLIQANTTDHNLFVYQIAHYSAWFRIIAIDLRGWGRSEAVTAPYGVADLCTDVIAICEQEGVTEAVMMGVSIGSKLGIRLALDRPDLVKALIAVGGSSSPSPRTAEHAETYRELGINAMLPDHLRSTVTEGFAASPLGTYLLDGVLERARAFDWKGAAVAQVFAAAGEEDMRPRLGSMTVPTLVINGEFDSSRAGGTETASLIPGARHAVLAGAAHCCNVEDPAGFDAIALDFLRDQGLMSTLTNSEE